MLSDWELWDCANRLLEQHGKSALQKAGERILDLEDGRDLQGYLDSYEVLRRIMLLLDHEPAPGEWVH